jgi:hypothetical protein
MDRRLFLSATTTGLLAAPAVLHAQTPAQDHHRHVRLDRLRAADPGRAGRHLPRQRHRGRDQVRAAARAQPRPRRRVAELRRHHGGHHDPLGQHGAAGAGAGARPLQGRRRRGRASPINSWADIKGKTFAVDGAGTTPYFVLAYMLRENGISIRDVTPPPSRRSPPRRPSSPGSSTAARPTSPISLQVRAMGADKGRILATTLDYPCVVDTLAFPRLSSGESRGGAPRGEVLVRRAGDDRERARPLLRDHGPPRQPDRRAVQGQRAVHRVAGRQAMNKAYVATGCRSSCRRRTRSSARPAWCART